ncbi:glycosyltransferase [Coraliomargarita sp. W4R53]
MLGASGFFELCFAILFCDLCYRKWLFSQNTPVLVYWPPTYREADNIAVLIGRIQRLIESENLDAELIIVDDDSDDDIEAIVADLGQPWVNLQIRKELPKGLSESVVDGLQSATKDVVVVMGADLSHPPEAILQMLHALLAGFEMCVGSRYVAGGSASDDWGLLHWLNSRITTCPLDFSSLVLSLRGVDRLRLRASHLHSLGLLAPHQLLEHPPS